MLSLRSIWRGARLRLVVDGVAAREVPSTSLRAGSSGLKLPQDDSGYERSSEEWLKFLELR